MKRTVQFVALAMIMTLAAPAAAAYAHVTLQPNTAPAGAYKRIDVRVPNERPNANTTKVELQFPADFLSVSYSATPGWSTEVKNVKLDAPTTVEGQTKTERVDTVTFTATGDGIGPNQFVDFGLSLKMPDAADTSLTFKAVQTYSNGEVVRWIGEPGSDKPAPQIKLTSANATTSAATTAESSDESDALSIVALVVGALGLVVGASALVLARRPKQAA